MKQWPHLLLCLLLITGLAHAQSNNATSQTLHIGIEKNRSPYSYIDEDKQVKGILIERLKTICNAINAECKFVPGEFNQLMVDVQTFKLHGMLVIDSFVAPEVDKLQLTPPLCKLRPVFIQAYPTDKKPRVAPEDFTGQSLGVREGSLLHLLLLDEYNSEANIRPYPIQESGVFDLAFKRIDGMLVDAAFYRARVKGSPLVEEGRPWRLCSSKLKVSDELVAKSMTLAIRDRDTDLFTELKKAIKTSGKTQACSCLVTEEQQQHEIPELTPPVPQK